MEMNGGWIFVCSATGSGKTNMIASHLLYFYVRGYRNFIFYVNSRNIIRKTKDNFLNKSSAKYVFAEEIIIDGKNISVREVENFSQSDPNAINILFTTTAGLHSKIQTPQENSITMASFSKEKTVQIGDEGHHNNSKTKKIGKKDKANKNDSEEKTWEDTALAIYKSHPDNVLLEYSAVIDIDNSLIRDKYWDKLIFDYSLAKFREDGYSKDVFVYQSITDHKDRMLQAVILSQYRRILAATIKLAIKPVILMKSKTIATSKENSILFNDIIKNLSVNDIERIRDSVNVLDNNILKTAFQFFSANISDEELIREIKSEFSPYQCLEVNSDEESEEKQLQLNSLEMESNPIRVIFAVNKLDEGWDVLNLFDIVRLYETRDSKYNVAGKTTQQEAELIGRGARYFPFITTEGQDRFKRKYDHDLNNELRVLEQLYYHSMTDRRYITELKNELIHQGIMADPTQGRDVNIPLKPKFKENEFYKNAKVFQNKRIQNLRMDITSLKSFSNIPPLYQYNIAADTKVENIFGADVTTSDFETQIQSKKLKELPLAVIRKAINKIMFFKFSNLKKYLPNLKSINEFIQSPDYCGDIQIELTTTKGIDKIWHHPKFLYWLVKTFESLHTLIEKGTSEFKGTAEFLPFPMYEIIGDVSIHVPNPDGSVDKEHGRAMKDSYKYPLDLSKECWYPYTENYGTSEEKDLVMYIFNKKSTLNNVFSEWFLIRSERKVVLYDLGGERFEPDFLFYGKQRGSNIYYVLYMEPKGEHLVLVGKWKEDALKEINKTYTVGDCIYNIIGLPFYHHDGEAHVEFETQFTNILKKAKAI